MFKVFGLTTQEIKLESMASVADTLFTKHLWLEKSVQQANFQFQYCKPVVGNRWRSARSLVPDRNATD